MMVWSQQQSAEWLIDTQQTRRGIDVTYARSGSTVALRALPRREESDAELGEIILEATERQWTLRAKDIVIAGSETLPKRGDTITEVDGGKTYVWEIIPGDARVFRFINSWRYAVIVNTQLQEVL